MKSYKQFIQEAHQKRKERDKNYAIFNVEPTTVHGIQCKSRLEALWVEELIDCEFFSCVECFQVPLWTHGPYGEMLINYKPDIIVENSDGKILIELKPTTKLALEDDRQKRAALLNPKYKFMIIGGYPFQTKGVTVRLRIGDCERVYTKIDVCDVLKFLGCQCGNSE